VRLAVLSESSVDEAAVRILAQGIRGEALEWVPPAPLRSRGWASVVNEVRGVIRNTYFETDAAGLIVVLDTNGTAIHAPGGVLPCSDRCRFCRVRRRADEVLAGLPPVPGRGTFGVAVGAAVPAIEAWYLCGKPPHPSEAAWAAGGTRSYDKHKLKRHAYGRDRGSSSLDVAAAEAARLAANLNLLRTHFPGGFTPLEQSILGF
jgi:hypothetical protein